MALESGTYINSLVATNPVATDGLAEADDHMRLIKATIKSTFPSITGAVTATHTQLNALSGYTGTVADLNYAKDLNATGVTATEFDYLDGVTSNIQTQLGTKQATVTGGATTILSSDITADKALISDASGKVAASAVTSVELGYLAGVTSNIQAQLGATGVGTQPTMQVFDTAGSATWTRPSGCVKVKVTVVGGGAGSAHAQGTAGGGSPTGEARGGGGGGGTAIKLIDVSSLASAAVVVGAGGVGGISSSTSGKAGSDSTFNTSVVGGGAPAVTGGTHPAGILGGGGGTASGGDLNIDGQTGGNGFFGASNPSSSTLLNTYLGGQGGSSTHGGGGKAAADSATGALIISPSDGGGYGGGAGGQAQYNSGSQDGKVGASGVVIVEEYY